jgi:predicted dehydrogenase
VTYGDVPAIVEANYFVPGLYRECVVVTEHGALVADYGSSTVRLYAGGHVRHGEAWEAIDRGKEELSVAREEPLRAELAAFLDACAGRSRSLVDARAGLHAVEIVEAAALAARLGRTVALSELHPA